MADDPRRFVLWPDRELPPTQVGGKAAALADLASLAERAHAHVPPWCVLSPQAFIVSLIEHLGERWAERFLDEPNPGSLAGLLPSDQVMDELMPAVERLNAERAGLAVRSSGRDEDGAEHSFAGQFESYLFVPPDRSTLARRIADVWRSGFSQRIVAYRLEHGLATPSVPAALIQRMVEADAAGVAFSADPVSGRRSLAVVSAVWGLGSALVGGEADADQFTVNLRGVVTEARIAHKPIAHRPDPSGTSADDQPSEGVVEMPVHPERVDQPAITHDQAAHVARLARTLADHRHAHQDIEWALRGEQLFLLQSRPITSLHRIPDPEGVRLIWDNANIVESYPGVTTPMTFSFARYVYEGVYREFCHLLGVPEALIQDNRTVFERMLGLIRGRVYYNLLNWYRLLAMLPGFAVNRRYMEQMMGVRQGLPDEIAQKLEETTWGQRMADRWRLLRTGVRLIREHWRIEKSTRAFQQRLDEALSTPLGKIEKMRLDELIHNYRDLERRLITRWDAPLVNDFLCMIFFGLLGKLTAKWCGDESGWLRNDLVGGEGNIISAEPARRIAQLAEACQNDPELIDLLRSGDPEAAVAALKQRGEAWRAYRSYLDEFGDRCLEELKLESTTLRDDPTPLLRAIGHAAHRRRQAAEQPGDPGSSAEKPDRRLEAEAQVRQSLRWRPIRQLLFGWVLRNARARVRQRENLRFERTRLFGRVRRILLEAGGRLTAEGFLDEPRDVFHLTIGEVLSFVEGAAVSTDIKGLVSLRRAEFERYRQGDPPPDRTETLGAVYVANPLHPAEEGEDEAPHEDEPGTLRGTGCCPGKVVGQVKLIRDPSTAELQSGQILVAETTDPGWIMLFPLAAGVLVQRGSPLSHSAIVAREMGIPAVVAVSGLMNTLQSGQWVEMDGAKGTIRLVDTPAEPSLSQTAPPASS